ncbi:phosphate signaling complex protein PhoU [Neobacillus mesonae]|uniref:Phosphate-specific transport system accessory protein PhoU n=1 Tax=Neobacillus mesonae TaxID=1193713 RepID=A0A3T0I6V4_9BACI|nr:phosphate signaling complex protein PhoU [Neobacillus mesonae]AZU65063.1 phosphate transport system regulatory protein PhoU [Neobacillus mesonae]MED4204416.1 phosphate signaling complex protein PhoU [Neobacillus mesonae]
MNTRSNFDQSLKELKALQLKMAGEAETAIKNAMLSLLNQDIELAKKVINGDNLIDNLEYEIHEKALMLIARQSPVAKDLRRLHVALRVSSEVERLGDIAVNIAKSTVHIGNEKHVKELIDIPKMMEMALEMVTDAITAFYSEDQELARKCAEKDDQVDEMFGDLVKELLTYIPQNPDFTNQIIQLAFVCRYIERIADHSTNIAENVVYLETGNRFNLNA